MSYTFGAAHGVPHLPHLHSPHHKMQTAQHVRLGGRAELAARPTPAFSRQRPLVAPRVGRTAVLASAKRAEDGIKNVLLPGVSLSQWGWGCNRVHCPPSRSVSWVRVAVQTRDHGFRGAFVARCIPGPVRSVGESGQMSNSARTCRRAGLLHDHTYRPACTGSLGGQNQLPVLVPSRTAASDIAGMGRGGTWACSSSEVACSSHQSQLHQFQAVTHAVAPTGHQRPHTLRHATGLLPLRRSRLNTLACACVQHAS